MPFPLSSVHRFSSRSRQCVRNRRRSRPWTIEGLEGRVLLSSNPAYFTVNLTSDTGVSSGASSGDLLWAVTQANANTNPAGSVIEFDPTVFATPQTITLSSTLELSESAGPEVIDGPSAGVVISGDGAVGVFQVAAGTVATLSGLTISGGSVSGSGGGINVSYGGTIAINDCTITGNAADNWGGGIFNEGSLSVNGSTIEDNSAGNSGGGIGDNTYGTIAVSASFILNNTASGDGGGIGDNNDPMTITGSTIEGNSSAGSGAGIVAGGTTTITDSTIDDNTITGIGCCAYGGGIVSGATVTITDSVINGNTSTNGGGGLAVFGTTTISGSTIDDNTATTVGGDGGGGIANQGTLMVSSSTIEGNSSLGEQSGGGIANNSGAATVTGCTIANNSTVNAPGAGVYNASTISIIDSTITGNKATDYGGGGLWNAGNATITGSTFTDNDADISGTLGGGGIFNSATLELFNSTIADNVAEGYNNGAGIYNGGKLTAVNTTIAYNQGLYASTGGGVYDGAAGTASLYNTIVAGNTSFLFTSSPQPDDIDGTADSVVGEYNLIGVDNTGSLTGGTSGNLVIGATNPGLGLLAYNGGPTQTIALLAGSPAINAGSTALAVDQNGNPLPTDQRGSGFPRTINNTVDIGAFERPPAVSTILTSSLNPSTYGQTTTFGATVSDVTAPTVYTVDLTSDTGASTGTYAGDLAYVINQANMNPNLAGSVIEFDSSVFSASNPQTIVLTSTLELAGPSGPMVIDGPGAGAVTISGGGLIGVIQVEPGAVATLSGLTISGGFNIQTGGGGIDVTYNSTLTVSDCTIEDNHAGNPGGGIDSQGNLTVSDSTFDGNSAGNVGGAIANDTYGVATVSGSCFADNTAASYGGAIYTRGAAQTITGSTFEDNTISGNPSGSAGGAISNGNVALIVTDCVISNNSAVGSAGGINNNQGTITVTGCTITGNSATDGGSVGNGGTMTLNDCTITGNSASGEGGGIVNDGALTVSDSTISANTTTLRGGGIYNRGPLAVTGCTISGNSADDGGGGFYNIYAKSTLSASTIQGNTAAYGGGVSNQDGTLTLLDCTIAGNKTQANAAGIFNSGALTAVNTTIAYNVAGDDSVHVGSGIGGGIYDYSGTTTLYNTIVVDNTADDGADDVAGLMSSVVGQYDLVGVDDTSSLTNGTDGNQVGVTDPGLASELANNGGATETVALLPGSPAIDAGSNALAVDPTTGQPLAYDQRGPGLSRIVNGTVDIGAFEVQSAPPAASLPTTTAITSPANPSVSGQSLTFVATVAPNAGGSGTPTGTVQFVIDGSDSGSPVTLVNGSATSAAISSLTIATHTIEAIYSGDANFVTSTGTLTQTVNVANSSPPPNSAPPTGTVIFYNGAVSLADEIGTGTLSTNSNGVTTATFSTHSLPAGVDAITAVYGGDTNFPQSVSNVVNQTVIPAPLTITSNGQTKVYGQANPALTVSFAGFVNGDTSASLTTQPTVTTTATVSSPVGSYAITASGAADPNYTISYVPGTLTISPDATTTVASTSRTSTGFGQSVTISATVTANAPGSGTPTGSVDFFDTTTGDDLGSVALSVGKASLSTASLPVGSNTIKVSYSSDGNFLASSTTTSAITINQSIIVLDPTAGGALNLSGSASINISGGVFVDSSSSSALSASGAPSIKSSVTDVHGGVQKSGSPSFSPAPVTGAAALADPLASLPLPGTSGLTSYGAENLSGNSSATIKPGIYSSISVSGSATLTLSAGTYIIEGGGFSVSGAGSVTGSGVTIVNAGSDYPNAGGAYGSISLSGSGTYKLTPPTTGTYAGIVIFQTRDNSKAMTVSGAASGMTGTIYASAAALTISGSGQLNAALDVDTLTLSGAAIANAVALNAPSGTVAYTPAQIRSAYGINPLGAGLTTPPLDGTGQTIAIVDAYDDPAIYQSLDAFDSQFGLTASGPSLYSQYGPASSFLTVVNQSGKATSLPTTDPTGVGANNWEVEEALDVEWAHAIAPGAQIILVEANSQSLSDLMASVATAAKEPGVSVVSMSWGFAEGQAVFASDEATYDSYFNVPGVTFVASTGDYGAADPEYPAFSPNVVAVGGTTLTINGDGSYNNETGWGYQSTSVGAFIGSGGGLSLYEPEPAYQQGVQSTGSRTTPDVSFVADPATGAWIADPYNLNPSDPFEVVGGTSLSAPAWAGLLALANQGRANSGESPLNSTSPTETQQALYMLPQNDYNVIATGNNGYSAGAGYNLVTGLGTPVANLLVPDLIAYQGPSTSYSGPTVAALQDVNLVNTGTSDSGPMDVFSVFDSLIATSNGLGDPQGPVFRTDLSSPMNETLVSAGAGPNPASPLIAAGITIGPATNLSPAGLVPLPAAAVTIAPVSMGLMSQQPGGSTAQPMVDAATSSERSVVLQRAERGDARVPFVTRLRASRVADTVLDELVSDAVLVRGWRPPETTGVPVLPWEGVTGAQMPFDMAPRRTDFQPVFEIPTSETTVPQSDLARQPRGFAARLAVLLLAAGSCGYGASRLASGHQRMGRLHPMRSFLKVTRRTV